MPPLSLWSEDVGKVVHFAGSAVSGDGRALRTEEAAAGGVAILSLHRRCGTFLPRTPPSAPAPASLLCSLRITAGVPSTAALGTAALGTAALLGQA